MTPPLACTVRGCGLRLERRERHWSCPRGHSFDIARSGYVNLLQPHDRRSRRAGDPVDALEARRRLHDAGIGRSILDAIAARAAARLRSNAVAVDLGCGDGDLLARTASEIGAAGIGIDLAVAAIDRAARRFPGQTWVVANADRRLPLLNRSVDVVLSVHGRRNPPECARVVSASGCVIIAAPAPDDLAELRAILFGRAASRDRAGSLIAAHIPYFALVEHATVTEHARVTSEQARDLARGTYRAERTSIADRLAHLDEREHLDVTLAADLFVFEPR
jgi:23S rRNA (guanine745-N1)-methyltransferase